MNVITATNESCATQDNVALSKLRDDVAALRDAVLQGATARLRCWEVDTDRANNIACYLSLRSRDLSELQMQLKNYGLSSLGRSEADVLASLDALLATLRRLNGEEACYPAPSKQQAGREALSDACARIFGADKNPRRTRVMATLPGEAGNDSGLISALIAAGMDCARINCAHDDVGSWSRMVETIRAAATSLGRSCNILMDLAGPKLRIDKVRAPEKYRLHPGERLKLVVDCASTTAPCFSLTMPEVISQLRVGAEVSFDDGKAIGRVVAVEDKGVKLEITAARAKGLRLKTDKGVNFPGTDLDLPPLTKKDMADLDFVAAHADLVGFSFVQRPEDVSLLQRELSARRGDSPPQALVLKIETPLAIRNLPELIVRATATHPTAVMIARGDLAVEVGFARLPELQEEILWLCEAAHVPVIWATQVLDHLVHEGVNSRPEATDAALAQQADCVMLNKGAFLPEGIRFLRDVLHRMERHHAKKFSRLPALAAWS
jgi:pyruvate kinase